jgi:hypothetical protein
VELALDGLLRLVMARISGVNNGGGHII